MNISLEEVRKIISNEIEERLKEVKTCTRVQSETPWHRVRADLNVRLQAMPGNDVARNQTLMAVATVIRRALGIHNVRLISPDREAEARKIGHAVLDLMQVPRS